MDKKELCDIFNSLIDLLFTLQCKKIRHIKVTYETNEGTVNHLEIGENNK